MQWKAVAVDELVCPGQSQATLVVQPGLD